MTQLFGILAHPVSHSFSPPMQQAAFDHENIDAVFNRFDIAPENLSSFLQRVRKEHISGLAVSLPHKENIIPLLDEISPLAKHIGAVNTVFWKGEKLWGDNTDAEGFWEAISPYTKKKKKVAAIIGAGGAARALVSILKEQGFLITICNRTKEKADLLAQEFSVSTTDIHDFQAKNFSLVCNATSVGLKENKSPLPLESWDDFSGIAFDAVFNPLLTRFLREAEKKGGMLVTGEKMLLFQGMRQFEIWTGKKAPQASMQEALLKSLSELS